VPRLQGAGVVISWAGGILIWLVHVANVGYSRFWFKRFLAGVLLDPSRLKLHGV